MTPRQHRAWARKLALEVALLRAEPARHDSIRLQATRIWHRRDEDTAIELGLIDVGGEGGA